MYTALDAVGAKCEQDGEHRQHEQQPRTPPGVILMVGAVAALPRVGSGDGRPGEDARIARTSQLADVAEEGDEPELQGYS